MYGKSKTCLARKKCSLNIVTKFQYCGRSWIKHYTLEKWLFCPATVHVGISSNPTMPRRKMYGFSEQQLNGLFSLWKRYAKIDILVSLTRLSSSCSLLSPSLPPPPASDSVPSSTRRIKLYISAEQRSIFFALRASEMRDSRLYLPRQAKKPPLL